jgi:hypothetical protein
MLLGFYKQFVSPIEIGTKVFTLRKRRKVRPKVGETLYMYTGGYNSTRTLISNKEKLMSIQNVRITIRVKLLDPITHYDISPIKGSCLGFKTSIINHFNADYNFAYTNEKYETKVYTIKIYVDRHQLNDTEIKQFAFYDGFNTVFGWADHWLGKKKRIGAFVEMFHWTDLKY